MKNLREVLSKGETNRAKEEWKNLYSKSVYRHQSLFIDVMTSDHTAKCVRRLKTCHNQVGCGKNIHV